MKVTFLGLGGHAGNLIDICDLLQYEIVGYIDDNVKFEPKYSPLKEVVGAAVLGFGALTPDALEKRYKVLADSPAHFVPLVHPKAEISQTAMAGDGVQVMCGAIIQHNAQIGSASIINTGAIVEHDAVIGKGCHIAPGAIVLGDVRIGDYCFVGSNSVVVQGAIVPDGTFVKANSVWK